MKRVEDIKVIDPEELFKEELETKEPAKVPLSSSKRNKGAGKKVQKTKKKKDNNRLKKVLAEKHLMSQQEFIMKAVGAVLLDSIRIIKNIIVTLIILGLIVGVIGAIVVFIKYYPTYSEYKTYAENVVNRSTTDTFRLNESSYIYDASGDLIVKLKSDGDSDYLEYDDIPKDVVNAYVAIEDRTFWDNPGIDVKGLTRVVYRYLLSKGDEVHGASTITQQLTRNIFLSHEVSLERKGKEMLISLELTKKYTKEQIMEFYINDICYGNAYYGIQAASKGYFNKNVNELSLSQIAYLCAIPNSPSYYDPYVDPERAITRRDKILKDMLSLGYTSKSEYDKAVAEEIKIEKPTYEFKDYQSTYAIDCAVRYLMKLDGFEFRYNFEDMSDYEDYYETYNSAYDTAKNELYTGGYKVYTSLEPYTQEKLQEVLDEKLSFSESTDEDTGVYELQGAITAYNNITGKVIAVIGGRSQEGVYTTYSLNRAYQSYRQPGSTIKPLVVYTPSLMNGYTPNSKVYNIDVSKAKEKGADVQSMRGSEMTLRSALEQSKNGVAWQLFDKIGADYALSFLNEMKFSKICPDDYYNSSSLGGLTYGTTTVEMAGAYATLENHGYYREATCLVRMIDDEGNNIYEEEESKKVYNAEACDTMVDMMTGVLTHGTAAKLGWYKSTDMVAAAKTGTTNNSKDGWLCGFTPYYTVSVWVGYDKPKTLSNLYGATYPGQIWKDCMLELIDGEEVITEFEVDESLYEDDEKVEYDFGDDLPDYAYDTYLPGREDSEELADSYYVYDYRKDRVIGEQVDSVINRMNSLDKTSPTYASELYAVYAEGEAIIDQIYSRKYSAEKKAELDGTYNSLKGGN